MELPLSAENQNNKENDTDARILPKDKWYVEYYKRIDSAKISGKPVSLLFLDINRLKEINDNLGHIQGDVVIDYVKKLTSVLVATLRTSANSQQPRTEEDLITIAPIRSTRNSSDAEAGLFGGDEIALFFSGDEKVAEAVSQRLHYAVDRFNSEPENIRFANLGFGVAIGSATLKDGMDASGLLKEADDNMYDNKLDQMPHRSLEQKLGMAALKESSLELGVPFNDDKYERKERLDNKRVQPEFQFTYPTERAA